MNVVDYVLIGTNTAVALCAQDWLSIVALSIQALWLVFKIGFKVYENIKLKKSLDELDPDVAELVQAVENLKKEMKND